jgi:hypothetical protein
LNRFDSDTMAEIDLLIINYRESLGVKHQIIE